MFKKPPPMRKCFDRKAHTRNGMSWTFAPFLDKIAIFPSASFSTGWTGLFALDYVYEHEGSVQQPAVGTNVHHIYLCSSLPWNPKPKLVTSILDFIPLGANVTVVVEARLEKCCAISHLSIHPSPLPPLLLSLQSFFQRINLRVCS